MKNLQCSKLINMDPDVLLILLVCVCATVSAVIASPDIQRRTYQHALKDGTVVTCNKCWPGHYLISDCTENNRNASCGKCRNGTFQPTYTQATECATCNPCSTRELVYQQCTAVTDTQCRCEPGHYRHVEVPDESVCLPHKKCPKGEGVKTQGNHEKDTKCSPCVSGYFSPNESSTQICQKCSKCAAGYASVGVCPPYSDTRCERIIQEETGLSGGAIAGIVCGAVLFISLCVLVFLFLYCGRREKGPRFIQNIYKKYITRPRHSTNGRLPNTYRYTSPGGEDQESTDSRLLQIIPDLSKDLIHKEWKFFFRYLMDDSEQLINEAVLNNPDNVREQIHTLFKDWIDREKEKATEERVIEALKEHDRKDLVQKYFYTESNSQVTNV